MPLDTIIQWGHHSLWGTITSMQQGQVFDPNGSAAHEWQRLFVGGQETLGGADL